MASVNLLFCMGGTGEVSGGSAGLFVELVM